jgi:predicted nucleic acid-binding protein
VIVIDASSLAKYVLREEGWVNIENRLLSDDVFTLDLALKEVLNAVWKHTIIHHTFTKEVALEKYMILVRLVEEGVVVVESEKAYLEDAFSTALQTGITIYDSLYIAQAMKRKARLLTSDDRQVRAAQRLGLEVINV